MMIWTADLAAEYARLTLDGLSPRHVAQAMGLARSCIYDHARVLRRAETGWTRQMAPPWTDADVARLREIILAGGTVARAMQLLGRTESAVRSRAKEIGLSLRQPTHRRPGTNAAEYHTDSEWVDVRERVAKANAAFVTHARRFEDARVAPDPRRIDSRPATVVLREAAS